MPAPCSVRPRTLALGLILPLTLVGAARSQQGAPPQGAWVDPPARSAGTGSAPAKAGKPRDGSPGAARSAASAEDALPKAAATEAPAHAASTPTRASALKRPAAREIAAARTGRRPTDVPGMAVAASDASGHAAAARALAARYLATVSAPGAAMVGAAPRFYATRVRFYGRPTTLAGLVAEKRSFVRRWPERRYEPRAIRTACGTESCTVRAVVDFRAANPVRGAVSSGAAELVLEISFAGVHPVIVAEAGRVLRRGVRAAALAPSRGGA